MSCPSWLGRVEINHFHRWCTAIHLINLHANIMLLLRGASLLTLSWKAEVFTWLMYHVPKHSRETESKQAKERERMGEVVWSTTLKLNHSHLKIWENMMSQKHIHGLVLAWLVLLLHIQMNVVSYVLKRGEYECHSPPVYIITIVLMRCWLIFNKNVHLVCNKLMYIVLVKVQVYFLNN